MSEGAGSEVHRIEQSIAGASEGAADTEGVTEPKRVQREKGPSGPGRGERR